MVILKKNLHLFMLLLCVACSSCIQSHALSKLDTTRELDLAVEWKKEFVPDIGISFLRPDGAIMMDGMFSRITLYIHPVFPPPGVVSEPQYLVTVTIRKFTRDEWTRDQEFQQKINKGITDPAWYAFREWACSVMPDVSMRVYRGRRYYRRTLSGRDGEMVVVTAEQICVSIKSMENDEAMIRRIIGSVKMTDIMNKNK